MPQTRLERVLADRAAEMDVEIRRGHELTGLSRHAGAGSGRNRVDARSSAVNRIRSISYPFRQPYHDLHDQKHGQRAPPLSQLDQAICISLSYIRSLGRGGGYVAVTARRTAPGVDRRRQRRQETIDEILEIAIDVMGEEGVAALSLSEVARRLGIRPPSLYKYFPSKLAIYDALFRRGWQEALTAFRAGVATAAPGLPALAAGVEAIGRYGMANQVAAQLTSWRPVPGFQPTTEAFSPSLEFVAEVRRVLETAVELGQLAPGAATEEGLAVLSTLIAGVMTQQLANEPDASFEDGHFTRLFPIVLAMFVRTYPGQGGQP